MTLLPPSLPKETEATSSFVVDLSEMVPLPRHPPILPAFPFVTDCGLL